jgi:hypothetical protein
MTCLQVIDYDDRARDLIIDFDHVEMPRGVSFIRVWVHKYEIEALERDAWSNVTGHYTEDDGFTVNIIDYTAAYMNSEAGELETFELDLPELFDVEMAVHEYVEKELEEYWYGED